MDERLFERSIAQAAELGIETIALTPITGDVFMDKNLLARLALVERSAVKSILFYTNFVGANDEAIRALLRMEKLKYLEISIYGHDLDSFCKITGRGKVQYNRLIDNLSYLYQRISDKPPDMDMVIGIRTYRSFRIEAHPKNALLELIEKLCKAGARLGVSSQVDNWGGDVTAADVKGIEMNLTDGGYLYKKGPCGLPFDSVQVLATGQVNACACRDPRGSLRIGDLNSMPLADILSHTNEKWMKIIEGHDRGHFNEVCRACGFYQSIHDDRRKTGPYPLNKQAYLEILAQEYSRREAE